MAGGLAPDYPPADAFVVGRCLLLGNAVSRKKGSGAALRHRSKQGRPLGGWEMNAAGRS
jgi:hypothetical protein